VLWRGLVDQPQPRPAARGQLKADEWHVLRRQLNDIDEKLYQLRIAEHAGRS
jgi:hypothetical protein